MKLQSKAENAAVRRNPDSYRSNPSPARWSRCRAGEQPGPARSSARGRARTCPASSTSCAAGPFQTSPCSVRCSVIPVHAEVKLYLWYETSFLLALCRGSLAPQRSVCSLPLLPGPGRAGALRDCAASSRKPPASPGSPCLASSCHPAN